MISVGNEVLEWEYKRLEKKVLDITDSGASVSLLSIEILKRKIDEFRRDRRILNYSGRLEYLSRRLNNYTIGGFAFST